MKRIALLLALLLFAAPSEAAFSWYRTLSVNHNLVGATDSVNFPVLFRSPVGVVNTVGTAVSWVSGDTFPTWLAGDGININGTVYTVATVTTSIAIVLTGSAGTQTGVAYGGTPWLATVANGGKVQSASGWDIGFYSANDCATGKLPWQIETWTNQGATVYWFNVPTASHTADSVYYLCYGDSGISGDASNSAGTWTTDTYFTGVWHFSPLSGTLSATNSVTGGASTVTTPTATTGQIYGAALVNGNTDNITTDVVQAEPALATYEAWAYRTGDGLTSSARIFGATAGRGQFFNSSGSSNYQFISSFTTTGGDWSIVRPATGAWHHFVVTYNGGATTNNPIVYMDGSSVTVTLITAPVGTLDTNTATTYLGNNENANRGWAGNLDEMRLSTGIIRTPDYATGTYNTQFTPFTFCPPGVETAVPAGGGAVSTFRALIGVGK